VLCERRGGAVRQGGQTTTYVIAGQASKDTCKQVGAIRHSPPAHKGVCWGHNMDQDNT
jgi:hypothetical protein